jgi:DNA-binding transcriptional ArsR family regulator
MPKERDEDSGQFTQVVADEEILAFLEEHDGASTADVAEEFDYQRPTAYRRLTDLREDGSVTSREVGNSLLWMRAE